MIKKERSEKKSTQLEHHLQHQRSQKLNINASSTANGLWIGGSEG